MISAMKLSIGNGQSYENVHILTLGELQQYDMMRLFGSATFCFQHLGKFRFVHADNVNVIHFNRSRPALEGAIPYEKLIFADDATYSNGVILLPEHHPEFGVHDLLTGDGWNQPVLFTANPEGLIMVSSKYIATLECRALVPDTKMELRRLSAQRLSHHSDSH